MPHARTLALDVGDRRIGIAITDALGITAQPLFTLHRTAPKPNLRADLKAVARFIRQHKVEVVIVGNPLHADGAASPQAKKSQDFAAALHEFLAPTHPQVIFHLVDERLTTRDAHALLDESARAKKISGKSARLTRTETIDQVAAVLLLEAWLAGSKPVMLPDPDSVQG